MPSGHLLRPNRDSSSWSHSLATVMRPVPSKSVERSMAETYEHSCEGKRIKGFFPARRWVAVQLCPTHLLVGHRADDVCL